MIQHVPSEDPPQFHSSQSLTSPQNNLHQVGSIVAKAVRGLWAIVSARRPIRIAIGLLLLIVGIAGLFLPILQGVATIVAALAILRQDIPLAERIWQRWVIPLEQRLKPYWQRLRQRWSRKI